MTWPTLTLPPREVAAAGCPHLPVPGVASGSARPRESPAWPHASHLSCHLAHSAPLPRSPSRPLPALTRVWRRVALPLGVGCGRQGGTGPPLIQTCFQVSVFPAVNSMALGHSLLDFVMAQSCVVLPFPQDRAQGPARSAHAAGPGTALGAIRVLTNTCALCLVEPRRARSSPLAGRASSNDSEGKKAGAPRSEEHGRGEETLQREQAEGTRGDRWLPARRTPSKPERREGGRRQERRGTGSVQNQVWEFEKITSEHVTDLLDEQETFKQLRHRKPSKWKTPSLFAPWVRRRWEEKNHTHRTRLVQMRLCTWLN